MPCANKGHFQGAVAVALGASRDKDANPPKEKRDGRQTDSPISPLRDRDIRELLETVSEQVRLLRDEIQELQAIRVNPDPMFTSQDAAELFNCSTDRIQQMEKEGLPFYRDLGKGHRYRLEDLIRFRDEHLVAPTDYKSIIKNLEV